MIYLMNASYKMILLLATNLWALLILSLVIATVWWFFIRKGHKNDK
jgi:hypothetical protein